MDEKLLDLCFEQSPQGLKFLFNEAYQLSHTHFSNSIHFFIPSMVHYETPFYRTAKPQNFPAISITGRRCYLNCEHCKGRLLEGMIPATSPQKLFGVCSGIKKEGGRGCLISGGSSIDGSVPLMDFIPTIKRVKEELGLEVVVHTGLVNPLLAEALAEANVDAAMIDIIGSNETAREIYHLHCDVSSFDRSLDLLELNGIPIAPHIVVGIHRGKLRGERRAIEMVSKHDPTAAVVVALMPLQDTPMESVSAPPPFEIARVVLALRLLMPRTPLLLGCARPKGAHKIKTDVLAIEAGVNGVAYPSAEVIDFVKRRELEIKFHEACCSLLWKELSRD